MRSDSFINLRQLYYYDLKVLKFQITSFIKQLIEFIICFYHRKVISNVDLYLDPIYMNGFKNSVYCPETTFIKLKTNKDNYYKNEYLIIWSGSQDSQNRKNFHLAMIIIQQLNRKNLNNYKVLILGLENKKIKNIHFVKKLHRNSLLLKLNHKVIYLMTSVRELNSVLIKEVLENNGHVIASPLPTFKKNKNKNLHLITKYTNIDEWCEKNYFYIKYE